LYQGDSNFGELFENFGKRMIVCIIGLSLE